jgi:hypothetical protein
LVCLVECCFVGQKEVEKQFGFFEKSGSFFEKNFSTLTLNFENFSDFIFKKIIKPVARACSFAKESAPSVCPACPTQPSLPKSSKSGFGPVFHCENMVSS